MGTAEFQNWDQSSERCSELTNSHSRSAFDVLRSAFRIPHPSLSSPQTAPNGTDPHNTGSLMPKLPTCLEKDTLTAKMWLDHEGN